MPNSPKIESATQFKDTPEGIQSRWTLEITGARENQKKFWEDGDKVIKEFLGEHEGNARRRLNLFYADVVTRGAQLYGNVPKVRARRRFADANDDVARVSAEMLERLLNTDIERDTDGFRHALRNAVGDWIKPGLGQIRFRYVVETEPGKATPAIVHPETGQVLAPEVPAQDVKTSEDVETDYVFWKDFLWSPARTWDEVRWVAYRVEMTKDAAKERFGVDVPVRARDVRDGDDRTGIKDTWSRCEVWEIWSKEDERIYWYADGLEKILEVKDDTLDLPGFFPSPEPLAANLTTSKYLPRASYYLAEHLYQEAHEITKRISLLVKACKVAGVYDRANEGVQRLLNEACENELIPIDAFASFLEKGGMAGAMAFLPLQQTIEAIAELVNQRNLVRQAIFEITGQSDIMRGQQERQETATTSRIKARFGSTRIQAEQDELARFASDAQRIRAAIIAKHFDPATIVQRSNIQNTADADKIQQAVELIKSDVAAYRVEVDADSLSMTDFDALQQEGVAIMSATADFFAKFGPFMGNPGIAAMVLELYQAFISQFRGAERYEGIIDRGIANLKQAAAQPPPPPQPDPKLQAAQVKAQAEMGKAQATMAQTRMDMQQSVMQHGMDMQKMQAEAVADRAHAQNEIAVAQARPALPGLPL